jgi:nicotinamide-nucleotide amidase
LLGQIANTNAQKISTALANIGVDVYFHTVVGDNLDRMAETIARAVDRADAVIVTGGLGPTPDDITREGIAQAFGLGISRREELIDQIRTVFDRMKRSMPEANLRQADLPDGAVPIDAEGTAPGFYLERDGAIVFALPGVPWEMEAMLGKVVIPMLRERSGGDVIASREVLVLGLGESRTHELIEDIVEAQSNPTIAYRAGAGQVRVRISAKAGSETDAIALIRSVEEAIRERLGIDAVAGNFDTLAEAVGDILRERGIMIGAAESLTGGLIGSALTHAGGSGDFFAGSLVCYTNEAKMRVAGVDEAILLGPGAVSEEAAAALAEGAAAKLGVELAVSATGVAGPSEQEGKPPGTIFVGATFGGRTEVRSVRGYGDRENIRAIAATAALDLGRRMVQSDD